MKKWSVLYLLTLYAMPSSLIGYYLLSNDYPAMADSLLKLFPIAIVLNVALGVAVIVALLKRLGGIRQSPALQNALNNQALAMKLLTVPFFVVNLLLWMMMSAAFIVIPGFQVFLLTIVLGIAFAFFVILVTSTYSIGALYVQFRNGNLPVKKFVWGVVMQLVFVVDVVSYVFLYVQLRRLYQAQITSKEQADV